MRTLFLPPPTPSVRIKGVLLYYHCRMSLRNWTKEKPETGKASIAHIQKLIQIMFVLIYPCIQRSMLVDCFSWWLELIDDIFEKNKTKQKKAQHF